MAILQECPTCNKKIALKHKKCGCGEDLYKAKRSQRIRYWIDYKASDGKQKREYVGKFKDINGYSIRDAEYIHDKRAGSSPRRITSYSGNYYNEQGKETVIYFIKNGEDGHIKIGLSAQPEARLKTLQSGTPYKLELIFTKKGDKQSEEEFHNRFKNYRASGEWFKIEGELKDYINQIMSLENTPEIPKHIFPENKGIDMDEIKNRLLTIYEFSSFWGIKKQTVYNQINTGRLYFKIIKLKNGQIRISGKDVVDFINSGITDAKDWYEQKHQ